MSASIASGVPVPITQPQNRGWMLPLGYGQDVLAELAVDLGGIGGPAGRRLVERRARLGGHRTPHGALADTFEVVHHVVHHPVAERSELAPVAGVEGFFGPGGMGRKLREKA